jgi:hypothetical protein
MINFYKGGDKPLKMSWIVINRRKRNIRLFHIFLIPPPDRGAVFSKRGVAPPTYSRSARCRSLGTSSQKFAKKTKFHKVLVKRAWHPQPIHGQPDAVL